MKSPSIEPSRAITAIIVFNNTCTFLHGRGWHNVSWLVKDDEFVGKWGYEFSFNADVASQGHYYLQSVSIAKQPHEKQGLWEYLEGSS